MIWTQRIRIVAVLAIACATLSIGAAAPEAQPDAPPPKAARPISLVLHGVQADQLNQVFMQPAGGYPGEIKLRPMQCVKPSPGAGTPLTPSNIAMDFTISHPPIASAPGVTQLCVFSVIIGDDGVASGLIVPAKNVPEVEDDEPVYEVHAGYAIAGGTWPAAKGKRGRAGAPGTQFVVEVDGDIERYYLLNTNHGHSVTVRADGMPDVTLDSNNDYVELTPGPSAGTTVSAKSTIASDASGARKKFLDAATATANRCGLPGRDPVYMAAVQALQNKKPGEKGGQK